MDKNVNGYILVLDDEVGVTRLCERFLVRAGYQVITTNYPQEGATLLEDQEIDLLLVDIRMPETDGFQMLKLARQYQPNIAVVIMTGYGTVETALESLHQGADGMLLKPFSGAELIQSVEQALRDRQRESEMLRLQALRPLFDISEKLFAEKSPQELRVRLIEIVAEHFLCSHVGFYRRAANSERWQLLAEQGKKFNFDPHWPDPWCFLEGASSHTLEEINYPELAEILTDNGFAYFLCAPLDFGQFRQVLFAARDRGADPFGEVELETLRILSRQAIVALENAHLYAELQERIQQVEKSQQALIQAEKMAAVGRLTASIAHEINNPLHSVRNCLHLAGRHELPEADRQEYLEMADEEMDRLMSTVRQMLDFYRPSAVDRKPSNLNELLGRVLKLLETQLSDHKITVYRRFSDELPLVLAVDNQIQQIFFNLILNAMEAMPKGGEISITSRQEAENVVVLVEDTGPGILEDQREEIFEPFVSSKEKGLGLGLTVSYGVVIAHGGSLTLLPSDGKGARFKLSLPAYDI